MNIKVWTDELLNKRICFSYVAYLFWRIIFSKMILSDADFVKSV